MEVVEIHMNKVASISDQCLANYMLYYVFFDKRNLAFSKILMIGFKYFKSGVLRSVNTLLNLFAKDALKDYIETEVNKVWQKFEDDKDPLLEDFARTFHVFRPEDAFILAQSKIQNLSSEDSLFRQIDFEKSTFKSDDDVLEFLTGYKYSKYIGTVIELLVLYVSKGEENAMIGFDWLKKNYGINFDSYRYDYKNENDLSVGLLGMLSENDIVKQFLLAYVKYSLKFEFHAAEAGRGNTVKMYQFQIKNSEGIKSYRRKCWEILRSLVEVTELRQEIMSILKSYASSVRGAEDHSIVTDDKPFVELILDTIKCETIQKAVILRDLYYSWEAYKIQYSVRDGIFSSSEWKLYLLLENEYIYSDRNYEEYEKKRTDKIVKYANTLTLANVLEFISTANRLVAMTDSQDKYIVNEGIEQILKILSKDYEVNLYVLKLLLSNDNKLEVHPEVLLIELFGFLSAEQIWSLLEAEDYRWKNAWQFSFFELIPLKMVNKDIYEKLLEYLKSDSDRLLLSSPYRKLRFLDKFLKIDDKAYATASRIIFAKKKYSIFVVKIYFSMLFHENLYEPHEVIERFASDLKLLKDIYFFMLNNDPYVDYGGRFLIVFLAEDKEWIDAYADTIVNQIESDRDNHDYHRLQNMWMSDKYAICFDNVFEKICEREFSFSSWRLGQVFKHILACPKGNNVIAEHQEKWVLNLVEKYSYDSKIIVLFDTLTEVSEDFRKKVVEKFLSLNSEYDMFEKLQLDPSHWGGSEGEIIQDIQRKINYLESLLPLVSGTKYLMHAKRIRDRISMWQAMAKEEELQQICSKLYG
jgi:hypothetical protein